VRKNYLGFLVGLLIFLPVTAAAQISVDNAIVRFAPGARPVSNVVISNSGEAPFGVEVVAEVVVNPGTPEEKRQATQDLIVSPKRFSIAGKGQRTIRLLLRKPAQKDEQIFRVKLLPNLEGYEGKGARTVKSQKSEVRIVTTVGLLIIADPANPNPELNWDRKEDRIVFENVGNSNVYLVSGESCKPGNTDCEKLVGTRLYPGNKFEVAVSKDRQVVYEKQTVAGFEKLVID
jgi:P pilus assembly chaperone PapD